MEVVDGICSMWYACIVITTARLRLAPSRRFVRAQGRYLVGSMRYNQASRPRSTVAQNELYPFIPIKFSTGEHLTMRLPHRPFSLDEIAIGAEAVLDSSLLYLVEAIKSRFQSVRER